MWSFPACPGSGMERVRLDAIRFVIRPYPAASQACVRGMRGCDTHRAKRTILYRRSRTACGVRMNALASSQAPHHSSPCKHADSFALLLVLSKPKHRFGFGRRNGGAAVELSGLHGKRNGASPFGRYPLPRSSFPSRKSSLRLGDAGCV